MERAASNVRAGPVILCLYNYKMCEKVTRRLTINMSQLYMR